MDWIEREESTSVFGNNEETKNVVGKNFFDGSGLAGTDVQPLRSQ